MESTSPDVNVTATGSLSALVESDGWLSQPARVIAEHPGLGVSAAANVVMGALAGEGQALDAAGRSSEVVLIPSEWVVSVLGDRFGVHPLTLHRNQTTELVQAGDIVVSGDYAGVMVRVLNVIEVGSEAVSLLVEPAAITDAFETLYLEMAGDPVDVRIWADGEGTRIAMHDGRDGRLLGEQWIKEQGIRSLMQCSGNADVGSNLMFDQPLDISLSLVPYSSLDIGLGGVNYWELGIEGSLEVSVAVSALLVAEASIDGKCSLNLNAIALPGFTILPFSVNPSIQPSVELSVLASAEASIGWVPVSGLQRRWSIDTGVRYIGGSGWDVYRETDASSAPAESPGFQAGGQLELDLQANAGASAGLAFCLGTCWLTPEIGRIDFLSVQGGPFWRFAIETPLNPANFDYAGPEMAIGVGASASAGIQASFFDSGILQFIPLSVDVGVSVEVFNERFNFHETPELTGSITCNPSCLEVPAGSFMTLETQLHADTSSSGTAHFWLQPPGSDLLIEGGTAVFSQQSAQAQFSASYLDVGTWRVFSRLSLDSPLFWFTEAFPVASIVPLGQFEVVELEPTVFSPLNDTGIDWCADTTSNFLVCPISSHPGQDGDHGRDALAKQGLLSKVGAGAAGFDYTKLDANGNDLPASASEWSCVRDNHTGLIWEVKADDPNHLRHRDHTYTWYNPDPNSNGGGSGTQDGGSCAGSPCDTQAFVQAVNAEGLCGASDWRIPTRMELLSLTHLGHDDIAIDQNYFPGTNRLSGYWSSSPFYSDRARKVYFSHGVEFFWAMRSFPAAVRLVRGDWSSTVVGSVPAMREEECTNDAIPRTTPSADFTLTGDGSTVRHNRTGLEWQRCAFGQQWDGATCSGQAVRLNWTDALNVSSGSGWRLPDIHELRSIVEECRSSPSINPIVFPGTSSTDFWSASPLGRLAGYAWYVWFPIGLSETSPVDREYEVRFVRDAN